MKMKILRGLRLLLGVLNLLALASLFLVPVDPIEAGREPIEWLACIARLQFGPAVLALDFAVLAAILVATFFLGRIYCEAVCPLGVAQDVLRKASFLRRQGVRRVCARLPVGRAQLGVRLAVLGAVVLTTACGAGYASYAWIDPYAVFCRALAGCEYVVFGVVAVLTFVGKGRIWCNWICPVGTVFAGLARISRGRAATTFDGHCKDCRACWPAERRKAGDEGDGKNEKEAGR